MPRSSVIWQSGSTLITPPDRASRRLFETRSSKKSGTRLIASIKESRPPAARRRDQLRRPDRAIRRSARPSTTRTLRGLRSFLEHHAFSRQVVPFRLLRLELVCPLPQRRSGVQVTFFDPGRPSDFPALRGAVRPHAFGWPALFPVRYLWSLLRWEGQCMGAVEAPKTPTLLDVLWVWGRLKLQNHERSLPRVPDSNLRVTASPTRIVGGGIMPKRNLGIEEGSVEAMARLQKQDEEFCRRLRAAIETGRECCPTTVFTEPCTNRPVSNYMRPDLIRGDRAC